jgi:hypothetical protein
MYKIPLVLLFGWLLRFGNDLVPSAAQRRAVMARLESAPARVTSELRYDLVNLLHECGLD